MVEKTITAVDAGLLVNKAKEEERIRRWNYIMDRIEAECICYRENECNFDLESITEDEANRLRDLGYTVEFVQRGRDTDYHRVSWPSIVSDIKAITNNERPFATDHYTERE